MSKGESEEPRGSSPADVNAAATASLGNARTSATVTSPRSNARANSARAGRRLGCRRAANVVGTEDECAGQLAEHRFRHRGDGEVGCSRQRRPVRLRRRRLPLKDEAASTDSAHPAMRIHSPFERHGIVGSDREQWSHRRAHDAKTLDCLDRADQCTSGPLRPGHQFGVPGLPEDLRNRPSTGKSSNGFGTEKRGIDHRVPRPVRESEILLAMQISPSVQQDRNAFGRVSVLVEIDRHAGDPGHPEIPGWQITPPRQRKPTDAGVDMQWNRMCTSNFRDIGDRVERRERVAGRGDDDQDRVFRTAVAISCAPTRPDVGSTGTRISSSPSR